MSMLHGANASLVLHVMEDRFRTKTAGTKVKHCRWIISLPVIRAEAGVTAEYETLIHIEPVVFMKGQAEES